jgi:hypothetical protein
LHKQELEKLFETHIREHELLLLKVCRVHAFDTLAQPGPTAAASMQDISALLVSGAGVDLPNKQSIHRRGKCKFITQTVILKLINVAKEKGADERVKAYWHSYRCQNRIFESAGKLY